jgi:hypothetical protein
MQGTHSMNQKSSALIQTVWNYAHVLKDDGLAFKDYTEQITYLLFLKMVHEQRKAGEAAIGISGYPTLIQRVKATSVGPQIELSEKQSSKILQLKADSG